MSTSSRAPLGLALNNFARRGAGTRDAVTLQSALAFLGLTWNSHARFDALTRSENLTPQVIAGKDVWHKYNCVNCHTLFGEGAYYAPDLTKIAAQRGDAYLQAYLRDPSKFYDERRHRRLMPTQNLSERETSGALETPLFDPIDLVSGAVAGKALARGGARAAMGRPAGPRVATGVIPRGAAAVEGGGATVELFHGTTSAGARSILREGLRPISTNTAPFPAGSFFTHVGAEGQVAASHWAGRSAGLYGGNPVLLRGMMSAEVFENLSAQMESLPSPLLR